MSEKRLPHNKSAVLLCGSLFFKNTKEIVQ